MINPSALVELARGRFAIEQTHFMDLRLSLGSLGLVEQGDQLITIEPEHALALSDKLARWAMSHTQGTNLQDKSE